MAVVMRFAPASPGFGLADHAVVGRFIPTPPD
jgi:hypothetical protein